MSGDPIPPTRDPQGPAPTRDPSDSDALVDMLSAHAPETPEQIGQYRILRLIGQGGMGAVYEAEQARPNRKVALKVIRPGMVSHNLLRRFSYETEMLGRLQHTGIAQIYDAGTAQTPAGLQPYFAMELVRGQPLLEYVAAKSLSMRERLQLLIRICEPVHYAHQKGIIHRDLKPQNILVDETGQPKILDFGVARTIDSDVQAATVQTEVGALVGTLHYMSPEQAAGDPREVDIRSDVYALGVIAFQVLSGRMPYELENNSIYDAVKRIREQEPTRLSTINRGLRGDVETIVSKALDKDKARRYQSASELGADIQRYLNDETILARPPDTLYQLSKFARRNKVLVGGALAALCALILGLTTTLWQRDQAIQNAQTAIKNRDEAVLREAIGMVHEGDALALAGSWATAKARYAQARPMLILLGASPLPADFGYFDVSRSSPDAIASITANDALRSVVFDPDGKSVLAGLQNGAVERWDIVRGRKLESYDGDGWMYDLDITPDGKFLAAASSDHSIYIWDTQAKSQVARLTGHLAEAHGVQITPDGKRVLSVSFDGTANVWDIASGTRATLVSIPNERINRCDLSPDGRLAALGCESGELQIFNIEANELVQKAAAHRRAIHSIRFTADGSQIVTGSADKSICVWDSKTLKLIRTLKGHENGVSSIAITQDGRQLVSGSWDRSVKLWDLSTGAMVYTFTGHTDAPMAVSISHDGRYAVSAGLDKSVRLWNLKNRNVMQLASSNVPVEAQAISPDSRLIAAGGQDGFVRVWDRASGIEVYSLVGQTSAVQALAFSPDGRLLASGSEDAVVRVWDVTSGAEVAALKGHTKEISSVSFLDEKQIASGSSDGTVRIWDIPAQQQKTLFKAPTPSISSIAALRKTSEILFSTAEWNAGAVRAFKIGEESASKDVGAASSNWYVAVPSTDERSILCGGFVGEVWLLDRQASTKKTMKDKHASAVMSLGFSPDAKLAISGGWDDRIKLWDLNTQELLHTIIAHGAPLSHTDFSPDGKFAVSSSVDGTVRVWDLSMATDIHELLQSRNTARRTLATQPEDPASLLTLGQWYARCGADDLAVELLDQARQKGAKVSPLILGECSWRLGRSDEAMQWMTEAHEQKQISDVYYTVCRRVLASPVLGR